MVEGSGKDVLERLARLEERVFKNHSDDITTIKLFLASLDKKVVTIMLLLAANFGTAVITIFKGH